MKTSSLLLALGLVAVAAACRIAAVFVPEFSNLTPVMALAFCGAAYLQRRALWLVPFAAVALSDVWINWHYATTYHYAFGVGGALARLACFAAALGLGALVARRRNWLTLTAGTLGGSLLFFVVTNTVSWAGDVYYAKTFGGWLQALTVGHPEFPPTLWFFRNTLAGDLLFTGVFALAMNRVTAPATRRAEA